ncbi:MAG: diguanylate cyclase, partial [Candidatus Omnitrophica bacterium]|nr:diguanylate cyclase [Candidatus Omnitrophota bacterium]
GQDSGFDDFLIKPFDPFTLQLRVSINIRRARDRVDANALTHLPGNHAIGRYVQRKIEKGEKFSVLYLDINHFKAFNDAYGFQKGDDVIRHTARILVAAARTAVKAGDYLIGHIGGDDFVAVVHPDYEEPFARVFLEEFDRIIITYYSEADQARGYVRVTNRRGKKENIALMSCSVAACNNLYRVYTSLAEIAQDAAQVKAFLKSQPGSHYLRDRRSEPIRHLEQAITLLAPDVEKAKIKKESEEPLGQTLIAQGLISEDQLTAALKRQFETGKKLGEILLGMKAVKAEALGEALAKKWSVVYHSLLNREPQREALRLFTLDFMKSRRIVPVETGSESVRIVMCEPRDTALIEDLERMLGSKIEPCLGLEAEMEEYFGKCSPEFFQEERAG